ncbi:MAG: DUF2007 domain-containing protein [Thiotrichales bacterium]
MKRVYTSPTPLMTGFIQGLLEHAGIDCTLKNRFLSGAAGDLPVNETWPELWVSDRDAARARSVIEAILAPPATGPDWRCPACGELLEVQFDACWYCGHIRTEPESSR